MPRRAWAASAVAAGAMAVGGLLVATRLQAPQPAGPVLAQAPQTAPAPQALVSTTAVPVAVPVAEADDRLLRDARLDRYLSAHKQWGSSFAMPVLAVRNTAAER
jgi:sigma-E factor negative regulatory protein RseA